MRFSALLDANVLVPNALRDTLLRVAEAGFYRPLWSREILDETRRAILRIRPNVDPHRLDAMFTGMNRYFSDALVTGYEPLVAGMTNDEGDRHVLAAAVVGRADVIVTKNLRDFPPSAVEPFKIEVLDPDRFLCLQYDLDPAPLVDVLRRQSAETGRSLGGARLSLEQLLESLRRAGAPAFANCIHRHLMATTPRQRTPDAMIRPVSPVTNTGDSIGG